MIISIESAYRISAYRTTAKLPGDFIVKFSFWSIKAKVLGSYWEQPDVNIEGYLAHALPDLSQITLRKKKSLKFVVQNLQGWGGQTPLGISF